MIEIISICVSTIVFVLMFKLISKFESKNESSGFLYRNYDSQFDRHIFNQKFGVYNSSNKDKGC